MQAPLEYPEQDYRFDRLRLRFRNPAVEQTFIRETLEQSINFVRVYLIAGTCLYICFGVLDTIVGGDLLPAMWTIRYGVVCPILLGIFALTFFPLFFRVAQPALALAMLASGFGIIMMTAIMPAPFNSNYYAGLIMVVIYCGSLIRLKFVHSLWISVALIAAYQVVGVWLNPVPTKFFVSNDFFLIMATGVGLFSGFIQEMYIRRAYISQKIIEDKNAVTTLLLHEANQANKSKSEFLATMSHEFRTPLNAIIGFSDIIKNQVFGAVGNKQYADYANDINSSGQHLLAIINDILDLAKADAGKVQLSEREVDFTDVLRRCARMCHERAQTGKVRLLFPDCTEPVYVMGDERLLLQIAINLVSNAVKFTPEGGDIRLTLQARVGEGVSMKVADTGIGIPPEDIQRVLRPFEQVETSYARKHGGSGLGLPYADRLIKLHGGELNISSVVGRGTTVTVRLPAERLLAVGPHPSLREAG
jgi:two-component system, cell cycle sensor histidine kinase PleC